MAATRLACPVCQARFRAERSCSRCGADLAPLMRLAARAHLERESAKAALRAADFAAACALAERAQARCATLSGRRLLLLMRWLASHHEATAGPTARRPGIW